MDRKARPTYSRSDDLDARSRAAQTTRGVDLRRTHAKALANLDKVGLSTTLVPHRA